MILTGDLGKFGSEMLRDLLLRNNIDLKNKHKDCGMMIYDLKPRTWIAVEADAAAVRSFSTYILDMFMQGIIKRLLFIATGALLSPTRISRAKPYLVLPMLFWLKHKKEECKWLLIY